MSWSRSNISCPVGLIYIYTTCFHGQLQTGSVFPLLTPSLSSGTRLKKKCCQQISGAGFIPSSARQDTPPDFFENKELVFTNSDHLSITPLTEKGPSLLRPQRDNLSKLSQCSGPESSLYSLHIQVSALQGLQHTEKNLF